MTEPTIDPKTGKPVEEQQPAPADFVPKSEFEALKQRLDSFERGAGGNYGTPQPPTPPAPSGPSFDEQIAKLDKSLEAIDAQIDKAIEDGKGVSSLMRDRDKINSAKVRLEVNRDIDPKLAAGMQTIDYLSGEVTRGKMPHLDIVKKDYEAQLAGLDPSQRMNPQIRQAAYNIAVGQNIEKIVAAKEEEVRRSVANDANLTPEGATGRTAGVQYGKDIPNPKEILGADALAALRTKGVTVDEYYKKQGYKGGWPEFWEKRGKAYFGDEGGEA